MKGCRKNNSKGSVKSQICIQSEEQNAEIWLTIFIECYTDPWIVLKSKPSHIASSKTESGSSKMVVIIIEIKHKNKKFHSFCPIGSSESNTTCIVPFLW